MKLLRCDGRRMEVYDLGDPVFTVTADTIPLLYHGYQVLDDDAARELLRDILAAGVYEYQRPGPPRKRLRRRLDDE